jgi:hypothetical protein
MAGHWLDIHDVDSMVMTQIRVENEIDREEQMEKIKNVVWSLF